MKACCTKADAKGSSCCCNPSVPGEMPKGPKALSCVRASSGTCPSGSSLFFPVDLVTGSLPAKDMDREPKLTEGLQSNTESLLKTS